MPAPIEVSLVVSERHPLPARNLLPLVQQVLKVSKTEAARVIHDGGVRVNGRSSSRSLTTLEVGDLLEVSYEPANPADHRPPPSRQAAKNTFHIVFEDDHLVVVNKPPGLLTVPTPRKERGTLISLLQQRLRQETQDAEVFCAHRLDRGVSGLLVFAKRLEVAQRLRDQFEARKPRRRYIAIVTGETQSSQGTFQSYLATDKNLNRYSTDQPDQGQWAVTHYRVLQTLSDATLVEVSLETGRRNQIRVHFAEAGHPVLGDSRYAQDAQASGLWLHSRLALHAQTLGFTHPVDETPLEFSSPLPMEMQGYLERAGVDPRHVGVESGEIAPVSRPSAGRRPERRNKRVRGKRQR